jgi:hypothetical protein
MQENITAFPGKEDLMLTMLLHEEEKEASTLERTLATQLRDCWAGLALRYMGR